MGQEIVIKNNFSLKSYKNAILNALLPPWLILTLILIFSMLFIYDVKLILDELSSNQFNIENLMRAEIYFLFIPIFLYFVLIKSVKISFNSDPKNKENIYHIFTHESFVIRGESFTTKFLWKDLLKIKEVKDFFLIFIAKNSFLIINKADLNHNQYIELKKLFNSVDIIKNLKND